MIAIDVPRDASPSIRVRTPIPSRYARILVAIDGTEQGDAALAAALALAADDGAVTLVGAFSAPHWAFLVCGYVPAAAVTLPQEECAESLRRAARRVPPHLAVRCLMRRGALDAALAREAAAAAYDLVALPARRPGLLRRTLGLGAARGLLRRSASSLLVLPNAQRDTPFPSSPTRQVET